MIREHTDWKQFSLIFTIAFLIYMAAQMIGTTVAPFADSMGAGTQYIGMITGSIGLMALLPRPLAGQIVDRENKKLLLFIVLGICILSSGILIVAQKPLLLLLSRGMYGLCWGVGSTLCMTSACNTLSEEHMVQGVSLYTLGQTLAMVLGPSAALFLQVRIGYRGLYAACTALMMIGFVMVFGFRSEHAGNKTIRYTFQLKEMFTAEAYAPAVLGLCGGIIATGTTAFVLLFAKNRGLENINWFFTVQAAVILILRPLLMRFVTDKNLVPVAIGSNVLYIVYLILITLSTKWHHYALSAIIMGVAMAGAQPTLMNLCVVAAGPERRGRATNTNYISYDIGGFLGPYLAGIVSAHMGYDYIFIVMIPAVVVGLAVFCSFYYRPRKT